MQVASCWPQPTMRCCHFATTQRRKLKKKAVKQIQRKKLKKKQGQEDTHETVVAGSMREGEEDGSGC